MTRHKIYTENILNARAIGFTLKASSVKFPRNLPFSSVSCCDLYIEGFIIYVITIMKYDEGWQIPQIDGIGLSAQNGTDGSVVDHELITIAHRMQGIDRWLVGTFSPGCLHTRITGYIAPVVQVAVLQPFVCLPAFIVHGTFEFAHFDCSKVKAMYYQPAASSALSFNTVNNKPYLHGSPCPHLQIHRFCVFASDNAVGIFEQVGGDVFHIQSKACKGMIKNKQLTNKIKSWDFAIIQRFTHDDHFGLLSTNKIFPKVRVFPKTEERFKFTLNINDNL